MNVQQAIQKVCQTIYSEGSFIWQFVTAKIVGLQNRLDYQIISSCAKNLESDIDTSGLMNVGWTNLHCTHKQDFHIYLSHFSQSCKIKESILPTMHDHQ